MRALSLTSPAFVAAISSASGPENTFLVEDFGNGSYGTQTGLNTNFGVRYLFYNSQGNTTQLFAVQEARQYNGYSVAFISGNWVFTTSGSSAANPAIATVNATTGTLSFFGSSYLSFAGDIFGLQSLTGQTATFALSFS